MVEKKETSKQETVSQPSLPQSFPSSACPRVTPGMGCLRWVTVLGPYKAGAQLSWPHATGDLAPWCLTAPLRGRRSCPSSSSCVHQRLREQETELPWHL